MTRPIKSSFLPISSEFFVNNIAFRRTINRNRKKTQSEGNHAIKVVKVILVIFDFDQNDLDQNDHHPSTQKHSYSRP